MSPTVLEQLIRVDLRRALRARDRASLRAAAGRAVLAAYIEA